MLKWDVFESQEYNTDLNERLSDAETLVDVE
jgi:hypothetical protein